MGIPDEWAHLDECDPLGSLEPVSDELVVARRHRPWREVAEWASARLPGQWYYKERGVTWTCGSWRLWVVDAEQVPSVLEARRVASALGLEAGWSVGSNAYAILRFLPRAQYPYKSALRLVPRGGPGYHDCCPGEYEWATMYDVRGYYFSHLERAPSLWPVLCGGDKLIWGRWRGHEEARWRRVLDAVRGAKSLRNALVGCMAGRKAGTPYYCRGVKKEWRGSAGPYRTLAHAVWRSGWELASLQSVSGGSLYTNTDCVVLLDTARPSVWEDLGFECRIEDAGVADVCSQGIYRVGQKETGWYSRGSRFREFVPRRAPEGRLVYPQFLCAA